ncbi:MAG: YraN family protein [Candidatus Paceibacteria bacterium]
MLSRSQVGQIGEELAIKHLKKLGFRIIERNVRRPWGELDIVAKKNDLLLFVEVKTLVKPGGEGEIQPEDELTFYKARKLQKAILMYFKENRLDLNQEWRLDLIAIDLKPDLTLSDLRHIENILFEF